MRSHSSKQTVECRSKLLYSKLLRWISKVTDHYVVLEHVIKLYDCHHWWCVKETAYVDTRALLQFINMEVRAAATSVRVTVTSWYRHYATFTTESERRGVLFIFRVLYMHICYVHFCPWRLWCIQNFSNMPFWWCDFPATICIQLKSTHACINKLAVFI